MIDPSQLGPDVRPPKRKQSFSTWGGNCSTSGRPEAAAALRGLMAVDDELSRSLTHGFHRYAGRMPPSVARGAIARWSVAGDVIVDPFCGSGTVMVEAFAAGRRAIGNDASPLAVEIARARTTLLDRGAEAALIGEAERIAAEATTLARRRVKPDVPEWAGPEFKRFAPHVAYELFGLRALMPARAATPVERALWLCFSSILGKAERNAEEDEPKRAEKHLGPGLVSRFFRDRAHELVAGLRSLGAMVPTGTPAPEIQAGDARKLAGIAAGSAALVVSSPPYAAVYDYGDLHDVSFRWLGLDRGPLAAVQIGAREGELGVSGPAWEIARVAWMTEVARVLRPGGLAMFVVGDGVVNGGPEDSIARTLDAARAAKLGFVATAAQERPANNPVLMRAFRERPRREGLVLVERT